MMLAFARLAVLVAADDGELEHGRAIPIVLRAETPAPPPANGTTVPRFLHRAWSSSVPRCRSNVARLTPG